jgi:TonB family protein
MSLMLRQAGALDFKPQDGAGAATAKARETSQPASSKKGPIAVPKFQYELEPVRHSRRLLASLFFHVAILFLIIRVAPWLRKDTFEALDLTRKVELVAPTLSDVRPPEIKPITPPVVRPPQQEIVVPKNVHIQQKPDVPVVPVAPVIPVNVHTPVLPAEKKTEVAVKKEVVVNTFAEAGSLQQSALKKPAAQVQTGGFGDPQGVHGVGQRNSPLTIASVGSFDAPAGPGKGNGTAGAKGTPGVVNSTGFGDGTAGRGTGTEQRKGTVTNSGFGTVVPAAVTAKARTQVVANTTPVQVDYKPRPAYTEDARTHRIEGEVVLEVLFGATGDLKVQRVVRGLGYGLDESAVKAASQIRFRPALQSGQPYASTALVHIVFELAQ